MFVQILIATGLTALGPLVLTGSDVLVASYATNTVVRLDAVTFAPNGTLGSTPGAQSLRYGPDGHLYVVCETSAEVLRFDGTTLAPLGVFVGDDPQTPVDETGGLVSPTGAVFGPDGDLYVADFAGDDVLRYDGATGAFKGTFVSAGSGGLDGPDAGLVFGPDGHLYVPGFESNSVVRYNGATGAFDKIVMRESQGLLRPRTLLFRDDGWLYVSSWGNNRILRAPFGGPPQVFVTTFRPTGFIFEPGTGHLLVANDQNGALRRYDGTTGALIDTPVLAAGSPFPGGTFVAFAPDVELHLARLDPGLAGTTSTLALRNATPTSPIAIGVSTARSSVPLPGCPGEFIGIADPMVLILGTSDATGRFVLAAALPQGLAGVTFWLQALDGPTCRTSLAITQVL